MKILALALAFSLTVAAPSRPPAADFNAARDEVAQLLSSLVKIDTSNPPGNEAKAAAFIRQVLDAEGIPSELFEAQPGRANLVARLKGSGRKRPILLMGHTDVVGVERDKWTFDPFGGTIKEGYVYGRGASDDKGMTSACLEVFVLLHRLHVPLDRDVIFLAEADEEAGGAAGINFMVQQHWDAIESEFALNEGGSIHEKDGKVQYVGIATTGTWQPPMRFNETTRTFFQRLATVSPPDEAKLFQALEDPKASAAAQET